MNKKYFHIWNKYKYKNRRKYISSNILLLPTKLRNDPQQQHSWTCKKKTRSINFTIHCLSCEKLLESLTPNVSLSFSIDSLQKQATKIFQSLRDLNTNTNITFQQFLESLEMSKYIYIKFKKPTYQITHLSKKETN
jgi:hypothetical protein